MIVKDTNRAIFLDRDGTISPDEYGYIRDPDGYSFYPETPEALGILKSLGYKLIVVTNQSGIARGYFGFDDLEKVHDKMRNLALEAGAPLDAVYFSPYFAEGSVAPYNVAHEDRKPGIGMFRRARHELQINAAQSFMIGDRLTDIGFAKAAGLTSILLLSGNGTKELPKILEDKSRQPHFICENILAAAQLIQRYFP